MTHLSRMHKGKAEPPQQVKMASVCRLKEYNNLNKYTKRLMTEQVHVRLESSLVPGIMPRLMAFLLTIKRVDTLPNFQVLLLRLFNQIFGLRGLAFTKLAHFVTEVKCMADFGSVLKTVNRMLGTDSEFSPSHEALVVFIRLLRLAPPLRHWADAQLIPSATLLDRLDSIARDLLPDVRLQHLKKFLTKTSTDHEFL